MATCYLGIDAGSTTTKVALVGEDGKLLYLHFTAVTMVLRLPQQYEVSKTFIQRSLKMPRFVQSCSTGYGEALIKSALMLDDGEVETVSHFYAAAFLTLK